ncbi:hypothetical protein HDG37_001732 [Paraburkholderia sp. MM5384-R2]|nr:hypothetical protein [Paraburkholderia sp. MM5384-R2]
MLTLHRVRQQFIKIQRRMQIDRLRGLLYEFGAAIAAVGDTARDARTKNWRIPAALNDIIGIKSSAAQGVTTPSASRPQV